MSVNASRGIAAFAQSGVIMNNPAETYESFMVPVLFAPCAARLIEFASPRLGERVLDVGCGTGVAARHAVPRVGPEGEVVAIDASSDMLAVARAVAEREGHRITWHEGPAEALPFPDARFDLVLCHQALQFFSDRAAALSETRRVLSNGGRAAIAVWQSLSRHPFYGRLHGVIQRRLGMSGVEQIFSLGDTTELESLLLGAGFSRTSIESVSVTSRFPNPDAFLEGEIAVDTAAIPSMQHLDAEGRRAVTEAISAEMQASLRDVTAEGQVILEFHSHLACAYRELD